MKYYWAYHLILDVENFDTTKLNKENLLEFIEQMISGIPLHFNDIGNIYINDGDLIFSNVLKEGKIYFHICDNSIYLDILSKKPYDPHKIIDFLKANLTPDGIRINYITREA